MSIAVIIWLCLFGFILISTFSLGTHYLNEWKTGLVEEAKYIAKRNEKNSYSTFDGEIAEAQVKVKISKTIWPICYIITFVSFIAIAVILTLTMV